MRKDPQPIGMAQRVGFCARSDITLNGEPARIVGPRNQFARVQIRASGLSAEWSWDAVAHVCGRDGAFKS